MSMPLTKGAMRAVALESSRGELAANWAIVGGQVGESVKSGKWSIHISVEIQNLLEYMKTSM